MWGNALTLASSSPTGPSPGPSQPFAWAKADKGAGDASSSRMPLRSEVGGGQPAGSKVKAGGLASALTCGRRARLGDCLCCKAVGRVRRSRDGGKDAANKDDLAAHGLTADPGYRDGTESGITRLSQMDDIPRYDESDAEVDAVTPILSTTNATTTTKHNNNEDKDNNNPSLSNHNNNCSERSKRRCAACVKILRKVLRLVFSIIGLSALVVGYSVGGAFLFNYLEQDQETAVMKSVSLSREVMVLKMWNMTDRLNIFDEAEWKRLANQMLFDFQRESHTLASMGWDGESDGVVIKPTTWTFASSLLYCITVITTIGYGNIAPKTLLGRMVTILYALIGIPLCLIWLTNLGSIMAMAFRFLYHYLSKLCCYLCCGARRSRQRDLEAGRRRGDGKKWSMKNVRVPLYVSIFMALAYILLGALLFSLWEKWEFADAAYFCFVTVSTIGFGDIVPGFGVDTEEGQSKTIANAVYLVLGLALIAMCFDLMQQEVRCMFATLVAKIKTVTHGPGQNVDPKKSPSGVAKKSPSGAAMKKSPSGAVAKKSPSKAASKPTPSPPPKAKAKTKAKSKAKVKSDGSSVEEKKPRSAVSRLFRSKKSPDTGSRRDDDEGSEDDLGDRRESEQAIDWEGGQRSSDVSGRFDDYINDIGDDREDLGECSDDSAGSHDSKVDDSGNRNYYDNFSGNNRNLNRYPSQQGRHHHRGYTNNNNTTSTTTNNNHYNYSNNNSARSVGNMNRAVDEEEEEALCRSRALLTRSLSVPPQGLAETVDLLEHVALLAAQSPPPSPRVRKRDRSRSPVRGRPKSRGPGSRDRGGNVDVATEEEEDDDDDDDDTLDGQSVASSTDLIKVAHAVRQQRAKSEPPSSPPLPSPPASPAATVICGGDLAPSSYPPYPYGGRGAALSSFGTMPPPPRGVSPQCLPASPAPRPQSRCQGSLSPARRALYPHHSRSQPHLYHDDADSFPSPPPEARGLPERLEAYGQEGNEQSVDGPELDFARDLDPPAGSSRSSGLHDDLSPMSTSFPSGNFEPVSRSGTTNDLDPMSRSAFSRPRPPSALDGRVHDPHDPYDLYDPYAIYAQHQSRNHVYHEPNHPQLQHRQQPPPQQQRQYQPQRQPELRQQEQHQYQQQYQQHPHQRQRQQANLLQDSDSVLPPRCISPTPKTPKTPQRKVSPSPISPLVTSGQKRVPPPTLPKTKKLVVSQAL